MELYTVLAAAITATALHRMMEPMNILAKLVRLDNAIRTKKIDDPQMKGIDTRAKSYGLAIAILGVMFAVTYGVISLFDASNDALVQYSIIATVLSELVLTVGIDKYHVAIEKLTKRAGK
ncbi:MAG: hypothetical protein ACI9T8_000470 [Candidatus Saccharimonadales bacterium]|jgi:hypothetical protein